MDSEKVWKETYSEFDDSLASISVAKSIDIPKLRGAPSRELAYVLHLSLGTCENT